jgi:tetratricopeptide (TPR) repeat protein
MSTCLIELKSQKDSDSKTMDIQRREAYYKLIYTLLNCAEGQESETLMANPYLIDDGLVETMEQVADMMAQQGNREAADYLIYIAGVLAVEMGMLGEVSESENASGIGLAATDPRNARPLSAHDFLMQLLQATTDSNGNTRDVYPLLEANLDKLDDNFVQVFRTWATATLSQEEPKDALDTATVIVYFSLGMIDFHLGNREINLEIAITGLEVASPITLTANPHAWGMIQYSLSKAYCKRIRGARADNQEKAIAAGKSALQVFNRERFPKEWALSQQALGLAYYTRILGEREDNLEAAIACYEAGLQVHTRQQFPEEWAASQNALGIAYRHRLLGEKAENIEKAIACYEAALQVHTRTDFPDLWAMNQNNLGLVYTDRIVGDRADNLEKAIAYYEAAFQVHNRKSFPENWATLQNNLGNVYISRIKGDKAENVEKAIACYQAALSVRTREALPNYWARTQKNMGSAYCHRIKGDRAKNLQMAIDCFQNALQVHTREAFPENWREISDSLAATRRALDELFQYEEVGRIVSQHRELLPWLLSLEFRTSKTVLPGYVPSGDGIPDFLAEIFDALAKGEGDLQVAYPILQANLDKINEEFLQRFQYWTAMVFPAVSSEQIADLARQFKTTDPSLLNVEPTVLKGLTLTLIIGKFSNLMLQFPLGNEAINAEIALTGYEALTAVFSREYFPVKWASNKIALGIGYSQRIRGERAENLEAAIDACEAALQVFTREDFPEQWALAQMTLGIGYCDRIYGNRADNLERALDCFQNAAQFYTRQDFPQQWANIQKLLSLVYSNRIRGSRADNLEMAIELSHQALQVITREQFPENWANIQKYLGIAYGNRIKGDQSENTELAIACYQKILQVHTREAFPADWAAAQNNLGIVYRDRIRGDRAENIEMAICCYQNALQVRTKEAFPKEWAQTQMNLGSAYRYRIKGDLSENLEMAIACAENALQVPTKEAFPQDWAGTQINLGNAYRDRIRGDRRENLNKGISALEASLHVHTRTDFPYEWATTQLNLGAVYRSLELIDAAMACGRSALEVFTPTAFPAQCLGTGGNLGNMAFAVGRWAEAIEGYSVAIEAVETSRTWANSESRRQEILAEAIDIYANMVQACINTGQLDKALETVERSRSKRLVDLMASNELYSGGEIPPEVEEYLQQYENLHRQIDQQRSQNSSDSSGETGGSPRNRAAFQAYSDAIDELEAEKQQI